jgi:large subunit ribosomal protein L21
MFAIIKTGGKQYKVTEGQTIKVEKLVHDSKKFSFPEVLMIADDKGITLGNPYIKGATVEAEVLRDAKAKKVTVVKYKAKVRYKRTVGHRQHFTEVKISKISL